MSNTILQLTDTHIHDTDVDDFYGTSPNQSLNRVIQHALSNNPKIDYVVVTGDLSHDGGEASARHLKHSLQQFNCPIYVTPGNHDDAHIIKHYLLDDQIKMPDHIQLANWQLLFADSHLEGQVHGQISDQCLQQLTHRLRQNTKPALLFTHHPPATIDCKWLDRIRMLNGDRLLSELAVFPNLKAIMFGHIHQNFEQRWEHFLLLGCPSTCIQFRPNSDEFATDVETPGYRLISLSSQGKFSSRVVRCSV